MKKERTRPASVCKHSRTREYIFFLLIVSLSGFLFASQNSFEILAEKKTKSVSPIQSCKSYVYLGSVDEFVVLYIPHIIYVCSDLLKTQVVVYKC